VGSEVGRGGRSERGLDEGIWTVEQCGSTLLGVLGASTADTPQSHPFQSERDGDYIPHSHSLVPGLLPRAVFFQNVCTTGCQTWGHGDGTNSVPPHMNTAQCKQAHTLSDYSH
jgi:hypothetical protein